MRKNAGEWDDIPDHADSEAMVPWRVGARVVLREPLERYPDFSLPAGLTGTVVGYNPETGDGTVRLDNEIQELEPWNNEVQVYADEARFLELFWPKHKGRVARMKKFHRNARYETVPEQIVVLTPQNIIEQNPAKARTHKVTFPLGEYDHLRIRLAMIRSPNYKEDVSDIIGDSDDVYRIMRHAQVEPQEVISAIYLSAKNNVVGVLDISRGGIEYAAVEPRILFAGALLCNASSIIMVHNHPSGNLTPSSDDIALTRNVMKACDIMGFRFLDHLVIGPRGYTSLAQEGLI